VPVLGIPIEWMPPTFDSLLGLSWFDQELQRRFNYPRCDGLIGIARIWNDVARQAGIPSIVAPSFSKFADDELPPLAYQPTSRFRILFVGRWWGRELPITLFRAMGIALERGVDIELVVVGTAGTAASRSQRLAERPALKALDQLPRIRERIRYLGFIPGAQLIQEMAAADAMILLRQENRETRALFPTRLPEFLASGRPVIVSDAGDLSLYLKHEVSAVIIPEGDRPRELADAIVDLATHPDKAAAIGLGGRAAVLQSFSQTRLAARIVDFIRSLPRKTTKPAALSSSGQSQKQLMATSE
jgi:glycosyltransferase involved in cell wall biosynthesis